MNFHSKATTRCCLFNVSLIIITVVGGRFCFDFASFELFVSTIKSFFLTNFWLFFTSRSHSDTCFSFVSTLPPISLNLLAWRVFSTVKNLYFSSHNQIQYRKVIKLLFCVRLHFVVQFQLNSSLFMIVVKSKEEFREIRMTALY